MPNPTPASISTPRQARVCAQADLWSGEMRGFDVEGHRVVLINLDGSITAFSDRCLHQGVALSAGRLTGCVLTCWAHEWQYDVRTGAGINPEGVALRRYPLEIRAGEIWIDLDATAAI